MSFTWTGGAGSTAYWLDIGSTPGGNDVYQSGNLGTALSEAAQVRHTLRQYLVELEQQNPVHCRDESC
ncbi:MAG: hypothetical protein WA172_07930 [Terriglobales bacterium]